MSKAILTNLNMNMVLAMIHIMILATIEITGTHRLVPEGAWDSGGRTQLPYIYFKWCRGVVVISTA